SNALQAYHDAWRLDYSRGNLNTLDEHALDEKAGIGGDPKVYVPIGVDTSKKYIFVPEGGPANFNNDFDVAHDPIYSSSVAADINGLAGEGKLTRLSDNDDWGSLIYALGGRDLNANGAQQQSQEDEVTFSFFEELARQLQQLVIPPIPP